jgi:hypothetical protein
VFFSSNYSCVFYRFRLFIFAQTTRRCCKEEKPPTKRLFLEQYSTTPKNLRLAENRALKRCENRKRTWAARRKTAPANYSNSIRRIESTRRLEIENERGAKPYIHNLLLNTVIAALGNFICPRRRDGAEAASTSVDPKLEPPKLAARTLPIHASIIRPNQQFARSEIQSEQRLIA